MRSRFWRNSAFGVDDVADAGERVGDDRMLDDGDA